MRLAASVAIAAAERVERTGGPRAGLAVWRRLADTATTVELRAAAILAGLRCAASLRDLEALANLSRLWETVDEGVWERPLFAVCKELSRTGLHVPATDLAASEVRRMRTARGLYLYARCLDVAGDARAAAAFEEAAERAAREGAADVEHASRVRRAVCLARVKETAAAAIEEAKRVDAAAASPREKLALARVLLGAGSRFVRASALGLLDDLVAGPDAALRRRALVVAATFADDRADAVTPLEMDRLLAIFAREPVAKDAARAHEALRASHRLASARDDDAFEAALSEAARTLPDLEPLHRRARDILAGRFEPRDAPPSPGPWGAILDVVAALRDEAWPRAVDALRRLAEAAERRERLPPQAFGVAQQALATDAADVRGAAGRLVAALVAEGAVPPRGWIGLANALSAAEMESLAETARRRAAIAREPGAADALGLALTRAAWRSFAEGDRARAIARLREAKALARG